MSHNQYLESLARHKFGNMVSDEERYLDKFVDIRLKLEPKGDIFASAVHELARSLPLSIPYGEGWEFSVDRAADLARDLAVHTKLSFRKVKRILLKVEVALRCYSDRPLDVSLLVFLAFRDEVSEKKIETKFLPRSFLTPETGVSVLSDERDSLYNNFEKRDYIDQKRNSIINESAPELLELPKERYRLPTAERYKPWALAFEFLAPHYIPDHQDVLNGVAALIVE